MRDEGGRCWMLRCQINVYLIEYAMRIGYWAHAGRLEAWQYHQVRG